jgi:septal ring factor EnvC (AmiA/AmiB activator)
VNETKQVWKDVAAILQQGGWSVRDERENAAPESGSDAELPSLSRSQEPAFYRWLPAGAIMSIVVCFLALFLTTNFGRQPPEQKIVEDLRTQLAQAQARLDALDQGQAQREKTLHEAEHSLAEAKTKVDKAIASMEVVEQSVRELQGEQRKAKEQLETTLKALRNFKEDMHVQLSTVKERLKQEHDQRIRSIEDIKNRLPHKPVESNGETRPK